MNVHVAQFPHHCWTEPSAWPLQSRLEMAPLPAAVPCARIHARQVLGKWRLETETVQLLVSDLVTNAVRASRPTSPAVRLWLCSDRQRVLVQVWDASTLMPVRQDANPDADHGRGLMIVDALSAQWGAYRRPGRKVVWAVVAAYRA